MNKKIFVYTLIFGMHLQMVSPALGATTTEEPTVDDAMAVDPPMVSPVVAGGKTDREQVKNQGTQVAPACPETQSKDELNKKLDALEKDSNNKLSGLTVGHRAASISIQPHQNILREFSTTLKSYCSKKIDIIAEKAALSPLALGVQRKKCGDLASLIQKYSAFEDGIKKSLEELEKSRNELYLKKFVPARDASDAEIKQKLSPCNSTTVADPACTNAARIVNERKAVWGLQVKGKPSSVSLFNTYLKAFDSEKSKITDQKNKSEVARAKVEELCKNMGTPIDGSTTEPVPVDTGAGADRNDGGDGNPNPIVKVKKEDEKLTKEKTETTPEVPDPSAPDPKNPDPKTPDPTTPEVPDNTNADSKPPKEKKSGGSWLSSPWLWGGVGAVGAGGLTYWFMNKKVDDQKVKTLEAKIALEQERLNNLNSNGNTIGTGNGTTDGTSNGTTDGGTLPGCNLSLVGAPGTAAVNIELPPIDISIINPDGKISTRDNVTNISMTCTGCSSMSGPANIVATAGVAKFTGIKFGSADKGVVLNFSGGSCNAVSSGAINVSEP